MVHAVLIDGVPNVEVFENEYWIIKDDNYSSFKKPIPNEAKDGWIEGITEEELVKIENELASIPTAEEIRDAEITLKVLDIISQLGLGV